MPKVRRRGMTLIELLVVVAIASTLATIALWNVADVLPRYRLSASASDVAGLLTVTRARAIAQNRPLTVEFRANDYRVFTDADADGLFEAGDTVLQTRAYEHGVTYYQPSDGLTNANGQPIEDVVVFGARGLAVNVPPAGRTVGLTNGAGRTRQVQVRYSGLVRKL